MRELIEKLSKIFEIRMSSKELVELAIENNWSWEEFVSRVPAIASDEKIKELFFKLKKEK